MKCMRRLRNGQNGAAGDETFALKTTPSTARRPRTSSELMTLAGLVVEIRAKAAALGVATAPRSPAVGLDGLVALARAHPTSAEAEAVVRILSALEKPQATHSFEPGILEALSSTTIWDLDALIGDMLEDRVSDQTLRAAVRKVRIRPVK